MHLHVGSEGHSHHHDHHDHDHDHDHGRSGRRKMLAAAVVLALLSVIGGRTVFFVDETEYVYVTQFGQPLRLLTRAGLGVKWPYQSLRRFDRRLQMFEPPGREMLTEDKENLTFQWFVCWRIPGVDFVTRQLQPTGVPPARLDAELEAYVRRFVQSLGSMEAAERRLEERVQSAMAAEIGRVRLQQLVSLNAADLELEPIAARVHASVRQVAAEQFGIEVVDVRLRRFNYPEAVKPSVYAEIRSERERVAVQYRAEGASQKSKIESLADLQRDQLLTQARRDATRIRGEGEAKAMEISNAAHSRDPAFYELLKTLETYKAILDDQTTVVLAADSPLLKLLTRGLPSLTDGAAPPTGGDAADQADQFQPAPPTNPGGGT